MRKTILTLAALGILLLDGWGATLAIIILIAEHWDFLSESAGTLYEERLGRLTRRKLCADLHARADAYGALLARRA